MGNLNRGEVTLQADDRAYTIKFSANAICSLEGLLDRAFGDVLDELNGWRKEPQKIRLTIVRAVLWAALSEKQPGISLIDAGDILNVVGSGVVMQSIAKSLASTWPDQEDGQSGPQKQNSGQGPPIGGPTGNQSAQRGFN